MALRLKGTRKYPAIPFITADPRQQIEVLKALKENVETGARRTPDLLNSFVRVQDLIDLGLIDFKGNTSAIVGADLSQIANIGDLTSAAERDFLRFFGGVWVNHGLDVADITQAMVIQHKLALAYPSLRPATFISSSGALTTPIADVYITVPFACRIKRVTVLTQGGNGSCVLDIWKDSYANFPPTVGDSITASAKPTISSGNKYQDTTLTGWSKDLALDDIVCVHLESTATFTMIQLNIEVDPL